MGYDLRNVFERDNGQACYTIYCCGNGTVLATYHYASSAYAGVCDMTDYSQTVEAESWNELRRKLKEKHPTGWSWK